MISAEDKSTLSVDDVLQETVRDPSSYYHGEVLRSILTAWDGAKIDSDKLKRAQVFLNYLINMTTTEV